MGLCHSKKTLNGSIQQPDITLSQKQINPPLADKLQQNLTKNVQKIEINSEQSEIDLLATDELVKNVNQGAIDQEHRVQVMRDISTQQHRKYIQKQYLTVYDALYHQNRKVPVLTNCRDSTLLKRRNNI
ncbi:hypothetical protein FGO68_gene16231 [Halteria grandinella]|uniref:Uncharacterized protein n=1 Tax=Halteria grandinella TaxID=5974 RepID=A0A8J8NIK7_HALGN|nr:hypothetical protein FGO68_gene16231 [Halteria grandinella]